MSKVKVPVYGTVGKAVQFDPQAGARAEAAVAALAAQISAGIGGTIYHRNLLNLQVGDDHPQYTMWQAPETIVALWNFQQEPDIEGVTLTEFIEDVVGNELVQDSPSITWAYGDTAGTLEANVVDEYIEDLVGGMLVDTSTVDFTYNDLLGQISATVPGAALTKTDDTNVTLTLGGSPTTALARAASLTLGWTGQLAVSRGGSGAGTLTGYLKGNGTSAFTASATIPGSDITGAALTKTDDTNVTLTLGGSPTTALLNASSLTLGWTGQLAVSRGGSGAGTLTGYLKGNGTSAFTASATIPYSDISGTPTIPTGANPSTSVGLSAVNGSATTFMRSDGAPALSQSIAPTWTGNHTFTPASGNTKIHAGNLYFDVDNLELQLGAGSGSAGDLRLYHDGTNSNIRNDTGQLQFLMGSTTRAYLETTGRLNIVPSVNQAFSFHKDSGAPAVSWRSVDDTTGYMEMGYDFSAVEGYVFVATSTAPYSIYPNGKLTPSLRCDGSTTAADTRLLVYDVTAGALVRVSRGASDSGGTGFRVLRVPN